MNGLDLIEKSQVLQRRTVPNDEDEHNFLLLSASQKNSE